MRFEIQTKMGNFFHCVWPPMFSRRQKKFTYYRHTSSSIAALAYMENEKKTRFTWYFGDNLSSQFRHTLECNLTKICVITKLTVSVLTNSIVICSSIKMLNESKKKNPKSESYRFHSQVKRFLSITNCNRRNNSNLLC